LDTSSVISVICHIDTVPSGDEQKERCMFALGQMRAMGFIVSALCCVIVTLGGLASAAVAPGTSSQVASKVAASTKIKTIPASLKGLLAGASSDFVSYSDTSNGTGGACLSLTGCLGGDLASAKTIVVYGDSHAVMWMPAILPFALANHYKVVLTWWGMCPVSQINVYRPKYGFPGSCNAYRQAIETRIVNLHPSLIIVAEKTAGIPSAPSQIFKSPSDWQSALTTSLTTLRDNGTVPVAVLEDSALFPQSALVCLSLHPNSVQSCSVPLSRAAAPGMQTAEAKAAAKTGSTFIPTHSWLCAKLCSPIVGDMFAYSDNTHISASYSAYLSRVMGTALSAILGTA